MSLELRALSEYPFEPGISGVNFAAIGDTQGREIDYWTESGTQITALIGLGKIGVYEPKVAFDFNQHYHLEAVVHDGVFYASVRTRKGADKHADFHAIEFIGAALHYFQDNDQPINSWITWWFPGTVNFAPFYEIYEEGQDLALATYSTWTGKLAYQHGFTNVRVLSLNEHEVRLSLERAIR